MMTRIDREIDGYNLDKWVTVVTGHSPSWPIISIGLDFESRLTLTNHNLWLFSHRFPQPI
jgi:hypothetical protein